MPDLTSVLARGKRKLSKLPVRVRRIYRRHSSPCADPTPVFVVGCQRSGTSMVMGVFDRSPAATVYSGGDRRAFTENLLLRDNDTIKGLVRDSLTKVVVFKPMSQLQHCDSWLQEFRGLRIIWLLRDVSDVVNSSVRKFRTMRETLGRIVQEPKNSGWWGERLSERSLNIVRENYRPDMSLDDAYALFWYLRNAFYFDLMLENENRVRIFRYEDLVANPLEMFHVMFDFCDCPFEPLHVREVVPSSVRRHAPPVLDPGIRAMCEALENRLAPHVSNTS